MNFEVCKKLNFLGLIGAKVQKITYFAAACNLNKSNNDLIFLGSNRTS